MPDRKETRSGSPGLKRNQQPLKQLRALLFRKRLRRPLNLSEDHILSVLLVRRARTAVLGPNLFSDPAWDILLELYAAKLGGRRMSVSDLVRATETPRSTAERWLAELENRGLITIRTNPDDRASGLVKLTSDGASRMEHLADHWGSAFVSI